MIKKIWVILGVIFLVIAIFFVNQYVSSLMEERFVNQCYSESIDQYNLALAELDESLCVNLTDSDICNDQIMLIKSRAFLNQSYCDKMMNEQGIPFCKMTIIDNNADVCGNLEGYEKSFCMAIFGRELDRCDDLPEFDSSADECRLFYYIYEAFDSESELPCYNLTGEYSFICRSVAAKATFDENPLPEYDYRTEVREDYCRREYLIQTGRI